MSISEKCAKFNFDDFFLDESDEDFSAIMIVTPRQNVCFVTEYHEEGAEEIMNGIYDDGFDFSYEDYWPEIVNDYGCVAIQLLKRGFVIVNLPLIINQFQYDELFNFYQNMLKINGELRKLGESSVELHSNVFSNGQNLPFGRALMAYKKGRVREFEPIDEQLVNESVKVKKNVKR